MSVKHHIIIRWAGSGAILYEYEDNAHDVMPRLFEQIRQNMWMIRHYLSYPEYFAKKGKTEGKLVRLTHEITVQTVFEYVDENNIQPHPKA